MVMYACVCVLKSHRRKIQSNLPCLAPVNTLLCLWNPPSFFHPVPSLLPLCSQFELSPLSSSSFLCVTPRSTPVTYAVIRSGREFHRCFSFSKRPAVRLPPCSCHYTSNRSQTSYKWTISLWLRFQVIIMYVYSLNSITTRLNANT